MMNKGYVHVYTGNGKGKTTAAFGLSLRAVGAGKKVFIGQFVKGRTYSEIEAIRLYLPDVVVKQYGLDCFIRHQPTPKDIEAARSGLSEVSRILQEGNFDLVVLDEASIALYYHLFTVAELLEVLQAKQEATEIVITGRYAPAELIDYADLVTEMKEIKHYYTQGIEARKGIEY